MRVVPLALCAFLVVCVSGQVNLDVFERWGNQFKSRFCLSAPHDIATGGWKIKLQFTHPVSSLQIWNAKVLEISSDGLTVIVENESYNQVWPSGETRCLGFIGTTVNNVDSNVIEGTAGFADTAAPEVCPDLLATGQHQNVTVLDTWAKNLKAGACITVPSQMNGWAIRLTFSKSVVSLTVWRAKYTKLTNDGQAWLLTNQDYNPNLSGGSQFCLTFIATFDVVPGNTCLDAYFVGADKSTPVDPTFTITVQPATTQRPVTTQPQTTTQAQTNAPVTTQAPTQAQTNAPVTTQAPTQAPQTTQNAGTTAQQTTDAGSTFDGEVNHDVLEVYKNVFSGEGTYYGGTTGGTCSYGTVLPPAATNPAIEMMVALNAPQFMNSVTCGMCLKVTGHGVGLGNDPVEGEFYVFVDNLCPECHAGDVDLGVSGDGRWDIEIQAVQCPVGGSTIQYAFQGSHQWYIKLQVRNARIPITSLQLEKNGQWVSPEHTADGHWMIMNGEWPTGPLNVKLTAANGEVLYDVIPGIDTVNNNPKEGLNGVQVSLDPSLPSM